MRGNITRRGARSYRLKYDAGERDRATGARLIEYVTVRGTRKDAERELTRILTALDKGTHIEPHKLTVAEYLERWLVDHAKHRVAAKTFERYAEFVLKHLMPALGAHQLAKLAPLHIQNCHGKALASGRRDGRGGLSARTVVHHHRVLSEALKQAVRWRLLAINPCELVDPPRPARREMNILDEAQTGALIGAAESSRIGVTVLLAATTGMRRGEILALRWRDLDLERRTLSVVRTLEETKKGLSFKEPKTERSRRTIMLPQVSVEALRRHRAKQASDRLRAGRAWADHDLVCTDALGEPIRPDYLTHAFTKLVARLGLNVRFHDLRHSHMSHLLAAGVHPKVASERAGHASVSFTLDTYSHVLPGLQEDAAERIDAALRKHLKG